jgi:undecaprenyl pyrophosphate phosphatase UppP
MYIDPNTGGMIFQILAVSFGAISAVVLIFSGRIRMALAKMRRRKDGQAASDDLTKSETPTSNL